MIIDAHNHIYYHGLNAEGVLEEMDRFGFDVTWLLTWYLPPGEHIKNNYRVFNPCNVRPDGTHAGATLDDLSRACEKYPNRFIAGYCPCPTEGNASAMFEAAVKMHNVRICGEWSYRTVLDDPRAIELFQTAGSLNTPVVLHIDTPYLNGVYQEDWYGGEIDTLERALSKCPNTIFVGHAPGFWRHISGNEATDSEKYPSGPITPGGKLFDLLNQHTNLWADLSAGSGLNALKRMDDGGLNFLITNQDRLLFGRDAPGNALQEYLNTLNIPDEFAAKIYSQNALRLVPLL
jgi:predicted TIM-barrel fold metal-dependent hydrolase